MSARSADSVPAEARPYAASSKPPNARGTVMTCTLHDPKDPFAIAAASLLVAPALAIEDEEDFDESIFYDNDEDEDDDLLDDDEDDEDDDLLDDEDEDEDDDDYLDDEDEEDDDFFDDEEDDDYFDDEDDD
jgi:hypothetical protein